MKNILLRGLFALALAVAPVAAWAAQAVVATPGLPQFPVNAKLQLTNGAPSGTVIDCTSATSGTGNNCNGAGMIITGFQVTSTDTSAQSLTCNVVNGATTYQLFVITVPLNAGNAAGTPPLQVLTFALWPGNPIDPNGNYIYILNNTDKITCSAGAVTATKVINIFLQGAAF